LQSVFRWLILTAIGSDWWFVAKEEMEFEILFGWVAVIAMAGIGIGTVQGCEYLRLFPSLCVQLGNVLILLHGFRYRPHIFVSFRVPSYIRWCCGFLRILRMLLGFCTFWLCVHISDS
jgi:hypothetical protein